MHHPQARTYSPTLGVGSWVRHLNAANLTAGGSIILLYAFGPVPLYLATAPGTGVDERTLLSGFFVVFASAGVISTILALVYRQPLGFGWSGPALIYMAAASAHFTPAEIAGASLVAGAAVALIGVSGLSSRIVAVVPVPIAMATFAGSSLVYLTGAAEAATSAPLVAGVPAAIYFAARVAARPWLPPVAALIVSGLAMVVVTGAFTAPAIAVEPPPLAFATPALVPESVLTLSLPLVVLIVAAGNLQGLAIVEHYGYRPPLRTVTVLTGFVSMLHALVAAPPATMQRAALAVMAGDEAGPHESRWVATVISGVGAVLLGLFATSLAAFIVSFPPEFIVMLMGLVLLTIVADAIRSAVSPGVGLAGVVALVIAASDAEFGGIGSTFWAMAAGAALVHIEAIRGWLEPLRNSR